MNVQKFVRYIFYMYNLNIEKVIPFPSRNAPLSIKFFSMTCYK